MLLSCSPLPPLRSQWHQVNLCFKITFFFVFRGILDIDNSILCILLINFSICQLNFLLTQF